MINGKHKKGGIAWLLLLLSVFLNCPVSLGAEANLSEPDYQFRIETDWLVMRDGTKLSVTYFLPVPRKKNEIFPVLFEYLPYRKDDYFYMRDYPLYTYFVRRGYVVAKVDIRGTGSSEGKVPDREYSEKELNDGVEIITQLAKKNWSSGRVGMFGISWSGFNSIQVAMRKPEALKAIMSSCATDDLYHDDIHFLDGAFHVDPYEMNIDTDLGLPRSPEYRLDEDYFKERFDAYPWFLTYLKNQQDGDFWRKNSLRWNYDSIQIPVFLLGGLLDNYRDSIPRMLENMKVPLKAEIGPYNHAWPDNGVPGPNYEWRHELVRWWDYWLKGINTGILDEPSFTVFVRDSHAPDPQLKMTPGQFRYETWPINRTVWKKYFLSRKKSLSLNIKKNQVDRLKYVPGFGVELGPWWGETIGDMRPADAGSLVYDSDILTEKKEIIGFPRIFLKVSADAKLAHWVARLEDVHPDGRVSLVTGAVLNGCHRDSRLNPKYLVPGKIYELQFNLHFTTWTFNPGHRIRLAVSNALFPMIWPTPHNMTTSLYLGSPATFLQLPVIPWTESKTPSFLPSQPREERKDARSLESSGWPYKWKVSQDLFQQTTVVELGYEDRMNVQGREHYISDTMSYKTNHLDPADALFRGKGVRIITLKDREIKLKTEVLIQSDLLNFHVTFSREIFENKKSLKKRIWKESIPREFQ